MATTSISEKDCYTIMERRLKGGSFQVSAFQVEPFTEILGFHGVHALLKINAVVGEGTSKEFVFFVKMATKDQDILNEYFMPMKFFYKEHILLTKVIKELQIYTDKKLTAECYLSRLNKFVVLENLMESGYEGSRVPTMDLAHAKVALDAFAQFHATTFLFEENGVLISEKYEDIIHETIFQSFKDHDYLLHSCHTGIKAICEKYFSKYSQNLRDEVLLKAMERIQILTKPSKKYKNVLCQGDPWGNNILYKYAGDQPKDGILIDFQTSRYAPPAIELMQFLYIATTTDFRKEHSKTLQDYYYDKLGMILAEKHLEVSRFLTKENFHEACDYYKEFGLGARMYYNYVTKVPGEYLKTLAGSPKKFLDFMIRGDPSPALSAWQDDTYKSQLSEAIEDVFEFYTSEKPI